MNRIKKIILCIITISYCILGIATVVLFIHNESSLIKIWLLVYILLTIVIYYSNVVQSRIIPRIRGRLLSHKLAGAGKHFTVSKAVKIFHPDRISFGDYCDIGEGVVFAPLCYSGGKKYPSNIKVGNNVHFGTQDRIASMNEVIIEDDVLFAAFVHVTDHSHEYRKVGLPIREQSVYSKGPVHIMRGAWLAFGCHVLSGVTVGECSVVAANSVVTKDVPAYSVVAGNPARIISRYNFETQCWERAQ